MGQVGEGDGEHDDKCTAASALFMSPSTPNSQGSMVSTEYLLLYLKELYLSLLGEAGT